MYQLIPDTGYTYTNLTATPIIILEEYVGLHVEIWGEQTWCVECGALDVDEIMLIEDSNCCDALQLAEENCGGLGCFIPQCTDDCEWESVQCWSSTGYCWCVDIGGNEIDGTSQPVWQGYPDCEEEITCTQGDLTNDDEVNVLDVVSMVNIILQLPSEDDPWNFWLCAGDLNEDGTINVLDVISLVNIILNPLSEDCLIIPEIGPCDGICPTYYYNQDNGQCEEFITGCCGVEAFETQQSCQDVCE
jgi:hypothetical protein